MKTFVALNKYLLLGFWLVFVLNLLAPGSLSISASVSQWVNWIGLAMLVVHVLEFVAMRNKLASRGHAGAVNFVQVMLFGILYWKPLLRDE